MISESEKESIRFYAGSDCMIINSLLWDNPVGLEKGIVAVYENNIAVIREMTMMTPEVRWGVSKAEGQRILAAYQRRTPTEITEATKARMIETAIRDIYNICNAMGRTDEDLLLYRNAGEVTGLTVGNTVQLRGITSSSTTGQKIDSHQQITAQYKIKVPVGTPVFALGNGRDQQGDDFLTKNNENEVILPPMEYKVTRVCDSAEGKLIELVPMGQLDVNLLIEEAKAVLYVRGE